MYCWVLIFYLADTIYHYAVLFHNIMWSSILTAVVLISLINSSASGLFTLKRHIFQSHYTNSYRNYQFDRQTAITRKHIYWESLNLDQKSISDRCFFPLSSNQTAMASWAPELRKTRASGAWWKHMELPERLTDALEKKGWSKLTASRYALKCSPLLGKRKRFISGN